MRAQGDQERSTINQTKSGAEYRNRKYICKFCKVPVKSKGDTSSLIGHEHKKSCPRHGRL